MPIDQAPSTGANTARLFGSLAVMTIGVAATLATILGFFGSVWWAFDLVAGYRLQLAVILLVVAAGFRIGFGIATGALFLAAAITNVVIVAPLFLGSRAEALASEGSLTIASVPVEETGREEALEWVEESGADIAFLLDTDDTWTGVRPAPGSAYYTADQVFIGRQTGMTIVARDGLDVTVVGLENTSNPLVRAETSIGDNIVVIYAMLLPSPGSDGEARQRNLLLEDVAARISAETEPVVVIGGLGASQWSHAFRVLSGKADLTDSSPGNGFQGSSPGGMWIGLRTPTHHLLHSDSLTTTERHLGPDLGHGQAILQGTVAFSTG
jgi:hypothetical protein